MAPAPLAASQIPPPVALPQVQLAVVMPEGSGSLITALVTASGPLLLAVIV
jgi:hypothetical protein